MIEFWSLTIVGNLAVVFREDHGEKLYEQSSEPHLFVASDPVRAVRDRTSSEWTR